jgi:Oxidoreductase-like protein, N-terminal
MSFASANVLKAVLEDISRSVCTGAGHLRMLHLAPRYRPSNGIHHTSTTSNTQRFTSTIAAIDIDRAKHPNRGGRNLTERYRRLEKSLRRKENRSKVLDDIPRTSRILRNQNPQPRSAGLEELHGFHFKIPVEPKPPESDGEYQILALSSYSFVQCGTECCMSGCAICVHDLYQDTLQAYEESLDSLRSSLTSLQIPEAEWPPSIRPPPKDGSGARKKDVSLSAFVALERALREKRGK